jgi:uncharacterized phage protein (TIGR02220 family)
MNYGLGRVGASDDEMLDPITREIDQANKEPVHCTAEDVKMIVGHLNAVCGTSFRDNSARTWKLINTRFGERYTAADFSLMIDHMHGEWAGTANERYLRPETLFGPKFEGYLQEAKRAAERQSASSFDTEDFFLAALARSYGDMEKGNSDGHI